MAGKKQFPNGTWQYVFKRAGVLEKPLYLTFASEAEGDAYAAKLDALLARGIVPTQHREVARISTIDSLIREYSRDAHPSPKDAQQLTATLKTKGSTPLASINAAWVDAWVTELKREGKLAPATIRAKIGALARATDWGMRKGHLTLPDHPFRSLPDGYAQYTKLDSALAGKERRDIERDRRLEPGEWDRLLAVIDAGVLPRKQRPYAIPHPAAFRLLLVLAVESAMRLREMYTLTVDQVNLDKRTIFLDKTKNGDPRQVPLSTVAVAALRDHIPDGRKMVFPWWDGEQRSLAATSDFLSKLFASVADAAGCDDLRFHDLRHHAVCMLFERTSLGELEVMKITGHKSYRMLLRYANLRGSSLAERMW